MTSTTRTVDRITSLCRDAPDERSLRSAVLDELRSAFGFDAYAWLLTDPETEVGGAPLADVPWLRELPRQIRLKYLTRVNRWTGLGSPPVALLSSATSGRPDESLVWREMLRDYGVIDAASLVFRDRFGCWSFLELWRTGGTAFRGADADGLAAITPPVATGLRRCLAATFQLAASAPEQTGPIVLVLSPDLEVQAQTPETEGLLRRLVPPAADHQPIPAGAYNVAAQLLAVEAGIDHHHPSARVHLSDGLWLTLRAARIGDAEAGDARPIAVTIERTSPAERLDVFVRAAGLSAREAELLGLLVAGLDTRRIAETMVVSEHTVQDHLKSIFAKTGAASRRELLARATGA